MSVVLLSDFTKVDDAASNLKRCNQQVRFKRHESKTICDIQSRLVMMGFSNDPNLGYSAYPNTDGTNNRIKLNIDVALPEYQRIFGEVFDIIITKYSDNDGGYLFHLETPLQKSSGTFGDVIELIETFINNNLKPYHEPIRALVCNT